MNVRAFFSDKGRFWYRTAPQRFRINDIAMAFSPEEAADLGIKVNPKPHKTSLGEWTQDNLGRVIKVRDAIKGKTYFHDCTYTISKGFKYTISSNAHFLLGTHITPLKVRWFMLVFTPGSPYFFDPLSAAISLRPGLMVHNSLILQIIDQEWVMIMMKTNIGKLVMSKLSQALDDKNVDFEYIIDKYKTIADSKDQKASLSAVGQLERLIREADSDAERKEMLGRVKDALQIDARTNLGFVPDEIDQKLLGTDDDSGEINELIDKEEVLIEEEV